ncbi:hypothetical protein BKA70DRAFT_1416966 [Coprinopsis sp. MPI-PUGE-AT-0042]|nr:hypothetical protein BKA70DRAFT_1416966 [Coprinopsis sp. MPI-PUGE-AT-0042]
MSVTMTQTKPTILLEPCSPSSSSYTASSSTSTTPRPLSLAPPEPRSRAPSPSHHGSSPLSARKIRFAPLPDPRRAVLVTENGEEVPIPNGEEATQISMSPAMAAFDPVVLDNSSLSSFGSSKRNSDTDPSNSPGTATPASTPSEYGNSRPGSPSPSPISLPPTPAPCPINTCRPATKVKGLILLEVSQAHVGLIFVVQHHSHPNTIHRTPIKRSTGSESTKSCESSSGWSLTRWTSTNSGHPPVKQWGAPLSRSQSSQSHHSKTPSLLSGLRPSSSGGRPKKQPVRKGTRMLNGRVYGGRGLNPNANLFANAPDAEPEFVEWGHGGMGSVKGVKSAGANSKWQRLGASQDEDLDDGGGMSWVKKRKEAREQKEREEREAKEKAEREAADGTIPEAEGESTEEMTIEANPTSPSVSESTMATPRASTPNGTVTPNPLARASSASINTHHSASTAVPTTPIISPATSADVHTPSSHHLNDDHVFTTMAVPMHRGHRHTRSRDGLSPPASPEENKNSYFDVQVVDKRDSSPSSSGTDSSSEDEMDDEEDDDDDEAEHARQKAMVIGAGMEKISRHREHDEPLSA